MRWILLVLILSGCASHREYGGYFDSVQLEEGVYRVSFESRSTRGRGLHRVGDLALLRSAQVAKAHGYEYFGIVEEDSYFAPSITAHPHFPVYRSYYPMSFYRYSSSHTRVAKVYTIACFNTPHDKDFFYPGLFTFTADRVIEALLAKYPPL